MIIKDETKLEKVTSIYKRNLFPEFILFLKALILGITALYYTFAGEPALGMKWGFVILVLEYSILNSFIPLYAHKVSLHLKRYPKNTLSEGIKNTFNKTTVLKEGTVMFVILLTLTSVVGFLIGTVLDLNMVSFVILLTEMAGTVGILTMGMLGTFTIGLGYILFSGIKDSLLVYIISHEDRTIIKGLKYILKNSLKFGLVELAYTTVRLLVVILTNLVGITLLMPWVLEWKYSYWYKHLPDYHNVF